MKPIIFIGIILLIMVLSAWLRRRRAARALRPIHVPSTPKIFTSSVGLVTLRELRERLHGRVFRLGTLFILIVVAFAIVLPTLSSSTTTIENIGIVGTFSASTESTIESSARSVGAIVNIVTEASLSAAHRDLHAGSVDIVVVNDSSILINKSFGSTSTSATALLAPVLAQNLGDERALVAADLTPSQALTLTHAKPLRVTSLVPATSLPSSGTFIIGLILLFVMLTQYNTWIMLGVMEEKSSRVVEVLLATLRPIQLLTGKVLGIGLAACTQAALIIGVALVVAKSVDSPILHGAAPLELLSTLVWLVLGFTFYCWIYAAAGSMAERQDQIQSLAFPLSLPIIFGYVVSLTAVTSAAPGALVKVLAYLPPTAPFAMPVLVGLGAVTWWQFAISVVISIISTIGVIRLAATIYQRAILRTGRRVKIRELTNRTN
jgi:ABC-2 type transport system permease protein